MSEALRSLHGSYLPEDVDFLLQPLQIEITSAEEKERLIQSQQRHYSEMIGAENPPGEVHQALYAQALAQNGQRMAADVAALAVALDARFAGPSIALVSFVRAGAPLGALLRRALAERGRAVRHYGLSIIRDRGLDRVALDAVIARHGAANIVFVDGWTGKGAIAGELARSLGGDPRFVGEPPLVTLADPCGHAWLAPSSDDWLIPSGILGATVSGLISRTIWTEDGGYHGCMQYENLRPYDVTRAFVETIDGLRRGLSAPVAAAQPWSTEQRRMLQASARQTIGDLAARFAIDNPNRIKPGIAEATRAVLRRVPHSVLVRARTDQDVQLLLHLAARLGIEVEEAGAALGPYRAVTIIKRVR
ncbi:MAG: cysteine protease StiP domain-containing protein [Pseudomonadota bacterium]